MANLNFSELRKKRLKTFLIVMGVLLIVMLYMGFQIGSYMSDNNVGNPISGLFNIHKAISAHPFQFHIDNSAYFWRGVISMLVLWALAFAYLYYDMMRKAHDPDSLIAGSAGWNNDYKGFQKKFGERNSKKTLILSQNVALSMNTHKTKKNLNVCIFGGSGEGKSRFYVKPNILQANSDMVVTDPAGELVESEGNYLVKQGFVLKIFNLIEMSRSNHYNPFVYVRDENGVLTLVNALIENTTSPDERGGEKFWKDSEKMLLQALIFYLKYHQPKHKQNFANVLELLRLSEIDEQHPEKMSPLDKLFLSPPKSLLRDVSPAERDAVLQNFYGDRCYEWIKDAGEFDKDGQFHLYTDMYHKFTPVESINNSGRDVGLKFYRGFKTGAGKTAKSILISCQVRLQAFNLPAVIDLTSTDDIHLEEFGGLSNDPERLKQALFAIIPSQDKSFNFLVSMLYAQLFETLYYYAITSPKCRGKALPRHVKFLLDEFANIGTIPDFNEKLSTMRKHEISCSIIWQSLSQMQARYEKDWESIIDNCSTTVFLGGQGKTTTTYISDMLGDQTVQAKDRSHSEGKQSSYSESYKNQGRKLMFPNELREKEYSKMVIIISGIKPFFDDKYHYEEHPNYGETGDADANNLYVVPESFNPEIQFEAEMATSDYQQTHNESKMPSYERVTAEEFIEANGRWSDYPRLSAILMVVTPETADEITVVNTQEKKEQNAPAKPIGKEVQVRTFAPQKESDDDDDEEDEDE